MIISQSSLKVSFAINVYGTYADKKSEQRCPPSARSLVFNAIATNRGVLPFSDEI